MFSYGHGYENISDTLKFLKEKRGDFLYPVVKVIKNKVEELGITDNELAVKSNLKDIDKGSSEIRDLLNGETFDYKLVLKLLEVLPIDKAMATLTLEDTEFVFTLDRRILKEFEKIKPIENELNRRKNFIPFLYRITSLTEPTDAAEAMFSAGMMKYETITWGINRLSYNDQIKSISDMIVKDYTEQKGNCALFGTITGYYCRIDYDTSLEFDIEGNFIGKKKNLMPYPNPL